MRSTQKIVAYHEAAHVAARAFTGDLHDVERVTILPGAHYSGRVEHDEISISSIDLEEYAESLRRSVGARHLLVFLAGHKATAMMERPPDRRPLLEQHPEEEDWEGTDLYCAMRDAEILARPGMSAERILSRAEKWTEEMLSLPEVWTTVEVLARRLLKQKTIEEDEICMVCESIDCLFERLPKWKRRLTETKEERIEAGPTKTTDLTNLAKPLSPEHLKLLQSDERYMHRRG